MAKRFPQDFAPIDTAAPDIQLLGTDAEGLPVSVPVGSLPGGSGGATASSIEGVRAFPLSTGSVTLKAPGFEATYMAVIRDFTGQDDGVTVLASSADPIAGGAWVLSTAAAANERVVPEAGVVLASPTLPPVKFRGPGHVIAGGRRYPLNDTEAGLGATSRLMSRIGDMSAFRAAIGRGSAKVVFWGDSITEGLSQISPVDSWPRLVARELQRRLPGVQLTFENFSIPGRGVGEANNPNYLGVAGPTDNVNDFYHAPGTALPIPDLTLWPGGTITGKSWREHIRDREPDWLAIALSINDTADPNAVYAVIKSLIQNYIATWNKKPSILLVTPIQPTRLQAQQSAQQANIEANAHGIRALAEELNVSLVDMNRNWFALRDGIDIVDQRFAAYNGLADYSDWLTLAGTKPAAASTLVFTGNAIVHRPVLGRDVEMGATFGLSGTQVGALWYRSKPSDPNKAYVLQVQRGVPQAVLYYNSQAIGSAALPASGQYRVYVRAFGARHQVFIDAGDSAGFVKRIDVVNPARCESGYAGLEGTAGASIGAVAMRLGYARQIGRQAMGEALMLGEGDDFVGNAASLGGNALNHPSAIGHYHGCFSAWAGIFDWVSTVTQQASAAAPVVTGSAVNTAIPLAYGDYVGVTIAANGGPSAMVGGDKDPEDGAGNWSGSVGHSFEVNANTAYVQAVRASASGGVSPQTLCDLTLNFPYDGKWQVFATIYASQVDNVIRHSLLAWGVPKV